MSFAGVRADHPQIARAVSFLVATQGDNGAWPMSRRSHSERDVSRDTNLVPITHLGSAWATLGLVRFVSPLLDSATAQARAIASIRNFSGTYETDQKLPGNPLVSAKIVYEIDDDQLASLAKLLAAIPGFRSLQLKSPHLTDDVSKELTRLSQLRNLSLEQAALTDAGLARLKALPGLEELNLKGTKVTAVGIADFQRTLPGVKVQAPGQ